MLKTVTSAQHDTVHTTERHATHLRSALLAEHHKAVARPLDARRGAAHVADILAARGAGAACGLCLVNTLHRADVCVVLEREGRSGQGGEHSREDAETTRAVLGKTNNGLAEQTPVSWAIRTKRISRDFFELSGFYFDLCLVDDKDRLRLTANCHSE